MAKNYTPTKDPNVVTGKYGVPITRAEFEHANQNGFAWRSFEDYADYVGNWARPITNPATSVAPPPYYRHYGTSSNIPTADVEILKAKYASDPKVLGILNENIAKPGEVPQYSPSTGDAVRQLIAQEKVISQNSNHDGAGLDLAMQAAKK